jgi:hypothetical protein
MSMYALAEPFTPEFNAMVDASVTEAVARLEAPHAPRLRDVAIAVYSGETLGPDLFPARNQARARQRLRDLKEQRREARQAGDDKMAAALSVSINQLGSTLV